MKRTSLRITAPLTVFALLGLLAGAAALAARPVAALQETATPAAFYSCDPDDLASSTPMAGMDHGGMTMDMGTPADGMDMAMDVEFDQLYIDMMIPHHASIVAMAQAALPELQDERLRTIAQRIIDVQTEEQEELRGYREEFYGSPDPVMDQASMEMMGQMMPGMGSMDEMMAQMDPATQVADFCAGDDPDLTFIDMAIAHHEMAITASEAAQIQAVHPETTAFADRVIADQQAEIDELTEIRYDLTGGTPQA